MRPLLLVVTAALLAGAAQAAPRSMLAWDGCAAYDGVANKSFACDVNTGEERIWCSVQPAVALEAVTGVELVIDLMSEPGSSLPDWWRFKNAGTCRQAGVGLAFDFTQEPPNDYCSDLWRGQAVGGISAAYSGFGGSPERLRILAVVAVGPALSRPASPDSVYNVAMLTVSHEKSVGADSCGGCATPVCAILNSFNLTQPPGLGDSSYRSYGEHAVVWQAEVPNCPAKVPARRSTWGAIKASYH